MVSRYGFDFIAREEVLLPQGLLGLLRQWRRERNWGRTFSTWGNVEESNPAYGAPAGGLPRLGQLRAMLGKDDNERL
jgi:hypothetical protein